jgi:hypothetical protein
MLTSNVAVPVLVPPVQLPKDPEVPVELVAVAKAPIARFDYSQTERASWREGGFAGIGGTKFTSDRTIAFAHEFTGQHVAKYEPAVQYASTSFEGAVAVARQRVDAANVYGGVRRDYYGVAVLQAKDGAYFTTLMPEVTGWLERESYTKFNEAANAYAGPIVKVLDKRVLTPWSTPTSSKPGAVSAHPRSNDEKINSDRVLDLRLAGITRRTAALQAIVDKAGSWDLRSNPVVAG